MEGTALKNTFDMSAKSLEPKDEENENDTEVVGLALWMPTTVGNEANHNGKDVPSISFGINLLATQLEYENDSFGTDYDEKAEMPISGIAYAEVVDGQDYALDLYLMGDNNQKIGTAEIPAAAVDTTAEKIVVTIDELDSVYPGIDVPAGYTARTFDIVIDGLKEGNTEPIKIHLFIGDNHEDVTVYHKATKITASYNPNAEEEGGGYIQFSSAEFSPYTAVYLKDDYVPAEPNFPEGMPEATVAESKEYVNTKLEWESYGSWSPNYTVDPEPKLEAAYTFTAPHDEDTIDSCEYKDWYCDFYVKLDKPLGENQIFLGGNYGSFGWIGFHNGDLTLDANTEIALLGSVTNNPWTYEDVALNVGTFICGVGDVNDALADATFTVMLRLTNPADEKEFYDVATINHTFTKTVNNAQELQDALNNGNENVELGDNVDLNDLFGNN